MCIVVKVVKKATISNVQLVLEHYLHVACFTTHESKLQLQEVVKSRSTLLFNLFCSNVAKQVAH